VSVGRPRAAARKYRSTRTKLRLGLLALGVGKGAVATWAIVAPGSFYKGFPASGGIGLSPLAYNEHLVTDLGGALLAMAGFLVLAAVELQRRLVQAALVAALLQGLSHLGYHVNQLQALQPLDGLVHALSIGLAPVLAIHLLVLSRELRRHGEPQPVDTSTLDTGRGAAPGDEAHRALVPSGPSRRTGGAVDTLGAERMQVPPSQRSAELGAGDAGLAILGGLGLVLLGAGGLPSHLDVGPFGRGTRERDGRPRGPDGCFGLAFASFAALPPRARRRVTHLSRQLVAD